MAWEKRGKGTFYYRSRRVGGRVVKLYCGPGVVGRIAAEQDARRRQERQGQMAAYLADGRRSSATVMRPGRS